MSTFCGSRAKGEPTRPQGKGVWPQEPGDGQSDRFQLPELWESSWGGWEVTPEEQSASGSQTRRPTGFDLALRPGLGMDREAFTCSLDSHGRDVSPPR